ncbi:MAG: hypothetical protein GF308_05265 [Candidatus Heimdallarchaeota archaeon]|nr:hypothetical protein [Candidatus Heimdallarchaeota archaeon]
MQQKGALKFVIPIIAVSILLAVNIGSCYIVAFHDFNSSPFHSQNQPSSDNPSIKVDEIIDPPLNRTTGLPAFTTVFTMFLFNLPIEVSILFLGEIVIGNAMGIDKKRFDVLRFLILLGSAVAITVVNSLVYYLMVWPAMHDLPIHRGLTFTDYDTGEEIPQYGDAPTNFSKAGAILILIAAAIIIIGVHFPAMKFIQRANWKLAVGTMVLPLLIHPIIWNSLSKQVTSKAFFEQTGTIFNMFLILSGAFVVGYSLVFLWRLSLLGTGPEDKESEQLL